MSRGTRGDPVRAGLGYGATRDLKYGRSQARAQVPRLAMDQAKGRRQSDPVEAPGLTIAVLDSICRSSKSGRVAR
jgi:hypothetical protein